MDRIITYHNCMKSFLKDEANEGITKFFHDFHITLVCDGLVLKDARGAAFDGYKASGKLTRINWAAFLSRTEKVHQDFLEEAKRQKSFISSREDPESDT